MVQRVQESDLEELRARLSQRASARVSRGNPPLFSSANLERQYRPLRGLLCSIFVHAFIIAGLIVVPVAWGAVEDADLKAEAVILTPDELDDVVYLPVLNSADRSSLESHFDIREPGTTRLKEGLSYPGPQPILSDPPGATDHTQTLLQPAHANEPILNAFMLPNLVRMSEPARLAPPMVEPRFKTVAPTDAVAQSPAAAMAVDVPFLDSVRRLAAPVVESKFSLPESSIPVALSTAAAPANLSVSLNSNVAAPAALPKPVDSAAKQPNSNQDLLALSPTPARADQPIVIPPGEVRGRFAISPQPNLSFPGIEPGTKGDDKGSAVPATNTANDNTAEETPRVSTEMKNPVAPSSPSNAFAGITILGGIDGPGVPRSTTPEPLQTSYGITILSSGGSGGGLRDFGVFGNEQVQTVYLDMRRTINDRPVSWTAQYAVGQKEVEPVNGVVNISIRQEVVLPFPITKELPIWPEEIVNKFAGRMITAFAIINDEGKIEEPTIKDSPDAVLNDAVLTALRKWIFRPARRDGAPVSAKMLVGISVFGMN